MPYCVMLEKGITYRPGGKLYPCCLWKWQDIPAPTDYEQFKKMREEKREQMNSSDDYIPECKQCMDDTEFKGDSFRHHANNTVKGGFWEMNFNNTCNLSCRMCNPSLSSTWASILKKERKNFPFAEDYTDNEYMEHVKFDKIEFYHELPQVKHIKLLGGEPFLMKEVYRMLDYVMQTKHSKNIVLEVTTNLTQPFDDYWKKVVENFKEVNVCGSVDGLGSRYEYIRPGGNFQDVSDRAKQILDLSHSISGNLNIRISAVGMTVTASQHHDIKKFWKEIGINDVEIEQCYEPTFMSYRSLHPTLRDRFNVHPGHELEYDEKEWKQLQLQMAILDKIHGTDFKTECPELFDL